MRHLISILLQNEAGALARVAGLFASRGYNIESLTVAATHDIEASRLSLVVFGDDAVVEQIISQTRKLVDVLDIQELTRRHHVERELVVVRVSADGSLDAWLRSRGARPIDEHGDELTAEFTGTSTDIDAFLAELAGRGNILDVARSGVASIATMSRVVA